MKVVVIGFSIIVFLFMGGCAFFANQNKNTNMDNLSMELSKIRIDNTKIDSLLNLAIADNQDYLSNKDCFLLLNYFYSNNDTNYVSIMLYEKEKFKIGCPNNDYSMLGYFEINNQTVLLIGNTCFDEIRFLAEKRVFTFDCHKKEERGTIPPPPSMYNPPIYTFLYEK
jgi:hypothetical protein